MKQVLGVIAILLALIAYIPYIRDVLRRKTKPHVYSWFIWGFLSILIALLQFKKGAGPGAYMTLFTGCISLLIFILAMRNGKKYITKLDTFTFVLALIASGIWLLADQPLASMILLMVADVLGSIPTIRKSWHLPYEETLFLWAVSPVRHAISIGALTSYNAVTLLNPATWVILNSFFLVLLLTRRKTLAPLT